MYRWLSAVALLAAVFGIAACGGGKKKTVSLPGGGDVQVSANQLPDGFPDDFPVYGGAKVTGGYRGTQDGQDGFVAIWETGDSVDDVSSFYQDKFQSGPWKSTSTINSNGSTIYGVENASASQVGGLTIGRADNKTTISAFIGDASLTGGNDGEDATATESADSGSGDSATSEPDDGSTPASSNEPLPAEVKLPKDFPSDRIPLPSDARVTSASSFGSGGQQTYFIEFYTKDSVEELGDYMDTEMPKRGWTQSFTATSSGVYTATYSAGEASSEAVVVTAEASTTAGYTKGSLSVTVGG